MDFLPTDDQRALQQAVRAVLADRLPVDALLDVAGGFAAGLWADLSVLGIFSLRLAEADGGLGLGFAETVLAFEELGAALCPGPLVASHLAAGFPGVGPGEPVTVLTEGSFLPLVSHLRTATHLVVLSDDGLLLTAAADCSGVDLSDGIDPLTPLTEVATVGPGVSVGDAADARRWRQHGSLLNAALQVGLAARLTELAVSYAKQREQFGKAVGTFQAVKHLAADMYVRAELATVAVEAAAVTLDDPQAGWPHITRAIAGAALLADEAAHLNARSAVQIHGGMGFTWEVPVHLYLKRAWVQATEWGDADTYAEELAQLL